jgi:hypothetical protein
MNENTMRTEESRQLAGPRINDPLTREGMNHTLDLIILVI